MRRIHGLSPDHVLTILYLRLKCDRQQPCKTCVDRGLSLSCTYTRNIPGPSTHEPKAPHNVHDRIDQLEKLVTTLMGGRKSESPRIPPIAPHHAHFQLPHDSSADSEVPGTPDLMKLEEDATSYSNSGHWMSILDGVSNARMGFVGPLRNYQLPGLRNGARKGPKYLQVLRRECDVIENSAYWLNILMYTDK